MKRKQMFFGDGYFREGKMLSLLKSGTLLLCILLFTLQARAYSQQKVTTVMRNVTIDEVIKEVRAKSDYRFLYRVEEVNRYGKRSIDVKNAEIDDFLKQLLKETELTYEIENNVIIIRPAEQAQVQEVKVQEIKGVVKDEEGGALPGVTIRIQGTNLGTATDSNGEFALKLPAQGEIVLVFSFVGMKAEKVKFVGQKSVLVVLYPEKNEMDEVVVTGFQVLDKRTLTSAISTVKAEDLEKMGALTVDQMLEGKAPGLMITNLSAQPGAAAKVRVRAAGTFTGSREPLWVIDGVVYEDPVSLSADEINSFDNVNLIGNAITGLNPQDIQDINILKDASATAIYGSRAANGVIVITTRRGKAGSAIVSYSGSLNIVDRPRYSDFNMMNSKERIDVSREIYERGLVYPSVSAYTVLKSPLGYERALLNYWKDGNHGTFQREVSRLETLNYDWFKEFYRPAVNHTHSVNVAGGSDRVRYYFSVGYDEQKGTEIGIDVKRVTARTNIDIDLRKNVLLSFGVDGSVQDAKYNHASMNVFNEAYYTSRAVEARDEAGNPVFVSKLITDRKNPGLPNEYARYNALHERDNSSRRISNKAFNFNVGANWDIIKGIRLSSRFAYRNTTNLNETWAKENTFYAAKLRGYDEYREDLDETLLKVYSTLPFGGIYSGGQTSQVAVVVRNQVNFIKILNEAHVFNLNITQEASSTKYQGANDWKVPGFNYDQGRKFISLPGLNGSNTDSGVNEYLYQSMLKWLNGEGEHSVYPSITEQTSNILSWVGIFTYSFMERYVFNFNIRSDGSNAFGQYERYKFRPSWSASLRWNIYNEKFMKQVSVMNELALRLSYGFRGASPNASPYLILSNYGHNRAEYFPENTSSLAGKGFPNANLRWEKTATVNAGLNYSFFENRLSGGVDYAYSKSTDLLLERPVSLVNGTDMQAYNGGSKNDHIFEFSLRGELLKSRKFGWSVNFNLTKMTEKILTGTNVVPGSVSINNFLNGSIMMKDFPVDGFFSYRFGGLDEKGNPTFKALYDDFDSEYEKLQEVLVYEGNRQPEFYGGFGTVANFKGFTVTANFSYKVGQKIRLLDLYQNGTAMPLPMDNMRAEFVNRWRGPEDNGHTNIPVLSNDPLKINDVSTNFRPGGVTSLYGLYDNSDVRVVKGDCIRWQSLTLSYSCPGDFIRKIGLQSLILRLQMQNLAVWALDKNLKGQDPEQVRNVGVPSLPSYNIGLNISF